MYSEKRERELNMIKGARKVIKCQKREGSRVKKCITCKTAINVGDKYTAFGLRPTTANEKFYARNGNVWYHECDKCA